MKVSTDERIWDFFNFTFCIRGWFEYSTWLFGILGAFLEIPYFLSRQSFDAREIFFEPSSQSAFVHFLTRFPLCIACISSTGWTVYSCSILTTHVHWLLTPKKSIAFLFLFLRVSHQSLIELWGGCKACLWRPCIRVLDRKMRNQFSFLSAVSSRSSSVHLPFTFLFEDGEVQIPIFSHWSCPESLEIYNYKRLAFWCHQVINSG